MSHSLKTPRLQLRACTLTDLPQIHTFWINEQIRQFLFDNRTISQDEARGFIEASLASFEQDRYGLWLVFANDIDRLIGFAGAIKSKSAAPSLIYGIDPAFWRRGYATESIGAVLRYLLEDLMLPKVVADVDQPNVASVRVLEKLGMSQTGREVINNQPLLYFERLRSH